MPSFSDHYCVKCGALEAEPARESCGNPSWHDGFTEANHYQRTCDTGGHCECFDNGVRCCTCRDRKL